MALAAADFDQAEPAAAERLQARKVAEGGDGDSGRPGGLEDGPALVDLDYPAVDRELHAVSLSRPVTLRTAPTFGGLKGSTDLAATFSSNYSNVTGLTLNPLSGTCTYDGVIANGAANMTLTKTGAGTQDLLGGMRQGLMGGGG